MRKQSISEQGCEGRRACPPVTVLAFPRFQARGLACYRHAKERCDKTESKSSLSQHCDATCDCVRVLCYDMKMTHGSRTLGPDKTKGHYRVIRTYPGTVLSFLVPGCCTVTVGCCSGTSGPGVMTRYSPVLMSRRCDGCMSGSCGTAALRGSPMTP